MPATAVAIPGLELVEQLGSGAQGSVFKARRGGQYYAVKVAVAVRRERDQRVARRFLREAVALARVRHPALPEVLEVGDVDGVPYIVMELARGESLAARLRSGPLPLEQVLRIGRTLGEALDAVHKSGLVHRDVKPANIVIDGAGGGVRLVDFGFVAALDPELLARQRAGTRRYMAPEQLGGVGRVDGRADLYSLGCVLYECLHGEPPEPGVRVDPSSPLAPVLERLVAPDPDDRFETGAALIAALDAAARGRDHSVKRRAHAGVPFVTGGHVPLLGREAELDRLRRALNEARAGRTQVVFVSGSPGSGKSRLARELIDESGVLGVSVLAAECGRGEVQPFAAVRQLLESRLDAIERLASAERLRAVAAFRELAGEVAPLLGLVSPRLARLFPDAPRAPRSDDVEHVMAEALAEFLAKLSSGDPATVVWVDDTQWLDTGSRRVLVKWLDRIAGAPVLALLAARSGSDGLLEVRVGRQPERKVSQLQLGRLAEADLALLAQAYLGGTPLDSDVVQAVLELGDGTPLGLLELLRAMLESGVLRPHWGSWKLDLPALAAMQLPGESVAVLARRIADLDPLTAEVLAAAAILGMRFEDRLLAPMTGLDEHSVHDALSDARRAKLVSAAQGGSHELVHATVRESLLGRLSEEQRRGLHQRAARALESLAEAERDRVAGEPVWQPARGELALAIELGDGVEATGPERWLAIAHHYAHGDLAAAPEHACRASVRAAKLAFRSFDNARAIACFQTARRAAELRGEALDPDLAFLHAEAHVRAGNLPQAHEHFSALLEHADEPLLRALALGRMAWIQMQLDEGAAWEHLRGAYRALGERPPDDSLAGLVGSLAGWMLGRLVRRPIRDRRERQRAEVLASLDYLACRLAVQGMRNVRLLQSTFRGVRRAERLGPSAVLARMYFFYSFLLTTIGFRARGRRFLDTAERIAQETHDPVAYSHALEIRYATAAWAGDIEDALRSASRCLRDYGHWRELSEFCLVACGLNQILTLQGRNHEAWSWLEKAVRKVSQYEGAPMVLDYLDESAVATLTSMGREAEADVVLEPLRSVTVETPRKAVFAASLHGVRIRRFTECMRLDSDFEALVEEVRAGGEDPRKVHLGGTDYYVHLAYARVHACLRACPDTPPEKLAALEAALADMRRAARVPLLVAHCRAVEGYAALFAGELDAADRRFAEAEQLGIRENAPWVVYEAHRGRAHTLLARGKSEAARDQARLAEAIAREHGAAYRARWVREELGLTMLRRMDAPEPMSGIRLTRSSSQHSSSQTAVRARGYLRALRRITQASKMELEQQLQSRIVLDEIVQALRAERGFLLLSPLDPADDLADAPQVIDASKLETVAARRLGGTDLADTRDFDRAAVEESLLAGVVVTGERADDASERRLATIAAPLLVGGTTLGALCLERVAARPFAESDAEMLVALAAQVPVALELARLLYARERAQEHLQIVHKMEAVARLAGGVAHDFNNWLTVVDGTALLLLEGAESAHQREDIQSMRDIVAQARKLTQYLLAFSRGGPAEPGVLDIGAELTALKPVLEKLADGLEVDVQVEPQLYNARIDVSQLVQVMTNLVGNARDASQAGGRIVIRGENVRLDDAHVRTRPKVEPGDYLMIAVSDSGTGMDEETRSRIFEPYFTTKRKGRGTGLGLAIVYGAITQNGGHIDVESRLGQGTTFRLYLPRSTEPVTVAPAARDKSEEASVVAGKLLVVDDDPGVLAATCRMLEGLGYDTVRATSGQQALETLAASAAEIAVLVTDIQMPNMDGVELASEATRRRPDLPVVFVSGGSDERLRARGLEPGEDVVTKPIFPDLIDQRIRRAVASPGRGLKSSA